MRSHLAMVSRWRRGLGGVFAVVLLLAGCVAPEPVQQSPRPVVPVPAPSATLAPGQADVAFAEVLRRSAPVIGTVCRERAPQARCDFLVQVDSRPGQPVNAYQSLDPSGRPIITFTSALIRDARNADELAFVLGHEAAHHIAGHLGRQRNTAMAGAVLAGTIVALGGGNASVIRNAQELGAVVGARTYSKDFELEADALGTIIAWRAGYDPERGAAFFGRIADPGNRFLGTHPPNAARIETVRRTLAALRAGQPI